MGRGVRVEWRVQAVPVRRRRRCVLCLASCFLLKVGLLACMVPGTTPHP